MKIKYELCYNKSDQNSILLHFKKCDKQFQESLLSQNLNLYTLKLLKFSHRIEFWNKCGLIGLSAFYIRKNQSQDCFISNFTIIENLSRNGLGSDLLSHTIDYAKKNGCSSIILEVHQENTNAQLFYRKNNFAIQGGNGNKLELKLKI